MNKPTKGKWGGAGRGQGAKRQLSDAKCNKIARDYQFEMHMSSALDALAKDKTRPERAKIYKRLKQKFKTLGGKIPDWEAKKIESELRRLGGVGLGETYRPNIPRMKRPKGPSEAIKARLAIKYDCKISMVKRCIREDQRRRKIAPITVRLFDSDT